MREILLVLVLLALFGLGYILVKKLDCFLVDNRKAIEKETETVEPSRIVLMNDLSEEEILDEIRRFKDNHKNVKIIVCADMDEKHETW